MCYYDNPVSSLINIGMWGLSFFLGHKSGEASVYKKMDEQRREDELTQLRAQIAELNRKLTPPPPPKF